MASQDWLGKQGTNKVNNEKTVRGIKVSLKNVGFGKWAIPENIHTIPRTAFRIFEGEARFTIMEFWGHGVGAGIYD